METGVSPARQARAQYRHELRTLTYLTLDNANGGVVRNLTNKGMGVQLVTAVRPQQQLRVRFELRYPRLRVETRGEVVWATFSGQCGIRFLDLPSSLTRQINEWILGDLLEGVSLHVDPEESIFAGGAIGKKAQEGSAEDDGLLVSATPVKVIELPTRHEQTAAEATDSTASFSELDWLSQPLSGRGLAWAIHTLVVMAGMLLFVLVFLAITREAPPWPLLLAGAAALVIAGMYWMFFRLFGGSSLGERLARFVGYPQRNEERDTARFR